jgi:CPA1 family monovalent cation:H+ antiporter
MVEALDIEVLVLSLFLVSSLVAVLGRRFRVPYTVGLVLAGLVLSLRSPIEIEFPPEIFLTLLLPPLLFEAAFHLNLEELRNNIATILILAIPGVILNMMLVGVIVWWGAGLALPIALVFGALIAASDPVAVVGIFRKLGAPKRLAVLLEGESLLNDGTAVVIFNLTLVTIAANSFSLVDGIVEFIRVAGGGVIIGLIIGWLISRVIARIDDHLVETMLTTVVAFGSYWVAEEIHVSGVLAVVAAGLVSGNIGPRGMSPTTRIVVFNFWEYAAFLANSVVFLLIGLQSDVRSLLMNWQVILWAVVGVLASRAVVVYLLSNLGKRIPRNWRHVLFWSGLRGAIALTLALSLPDAFEQWRETVISMTFGVVLFSMIVQGFSMDRILWRLKVIETSEGKLEYERRQARALAARAGFDHLKQLSREGLISNHTWENLRPVIEMRLDVLTKEVQEVLHDAPDLEAQELFTARREMLRAQRSSLATLRRDGVISDMSYEELVTEIDASIESTLDGWEQYTNKDEFEDICQLMMVVVQESDLLAAMHALSNRGIYSTHIRSRGAFLRQQNHLLLVGIPEGKLKLVVEALRKSCKSRVEYVSSPFDEIPFGVTSSLEVKVSGATVFVFDVERCEVI